MRAALHPDPIIRLVVEDENTRPWQLHFLRRRQPNIQTLDRTQQERSIAIPQLMRQLPRNLARVRTGEDAGRHGRAHQHDGEVDVVPGEQEHAITGLEAALLETGGKALAPEPIGVRRDVVVIGPFGVDEAAGCFGEEVGGRGEEEGGDGAGGNVGGEA